MALNMTSADAVLKEDYLPNVREQLNNEGIVSLIEKDEDNIIEGRRAVLALHVGRNEGIGARAEGEALAAAGSQSYTDEYVTLKYNYGQIKVSGQVIAATKSNTGSFVRAVNSEMSGVTNDLKRDFSRQIWGTSNGVIAKCGTTTTSTTVVLTGATPSQMRHFHKGMKVDIGTVASPSLIVGGATIASVDVAGLTITIDSSVSTTSADFVFRAGNGGTSPQREVTGLQSIVAASGALFNVDPSTYPVWASFVDGNSGTNRAVTEMMFANAQQQTHILSGADIELWLTSDGVNRAYAALLIGEKRYPGTTKLAGGYMGISAAAGGTREVAVTWDRDCPNNSAFGLTLSHITEYRASDWDWMDRDGNVLQRALDGSDAYQATLFKYAEVATDQRNVHCKIVDLTEG